VREDPFTALDGNRANPDATSLFAAARRETAAVGVRAPADTSVPPDGAWPVRIAVGSPGQVTLRLIREGAAPLDSAIASVQVDSVSIVPLSLMGAGKSLLPAGHYQLVGERVDGAGAGPGAALTMDVVRVTADTTSHDLPPAFRPETRLGPPSTWSLFRGLFFGAAAATLPMILSGAERDGGGVDTRALTVSATLVTAGVVGVFAGRQRLSLPDNISLNESLRGAWEDRNRAIAADNAERRLRAPVRIQSRGRS
jgi:hypothetical protein